MTKPIYILVFIFLSILFNGCDFADYKLSLINKSDTAIIVKAKLINKTDDTGVCDTYDEIEGNSTKKLPLLNIYWDDLYQEYGEDAILKVEIVTVKLDEFDYKHKHSHDFFQQKIDNKAYLVGFYTRNELDNLNWKITFPSDKIRKPL